MRKRVVFLNLLLLAACLSARAAEPSVEMKTSFKEITADRAMTCFKHQPEGTFEAILKDEPKSHAELDVNRSIEWTISPTQDVSFTPTSELKRTLTLQNMNTLFKSYAVEVVVTWELVDKLANTTSYIIKSANMTLDVKAFSVGLEAVPAGNEPELDNGRICRNAQSDYRKAKWKVTVLPEETTATVTPVSSNVTITDGGGIMNDEAVWVNGVAVGEYKIKITHDDCDQCTATSGEKVFVFKFADTVSSSDGPKEISMSGGAATDGYKVLTGSGPDHVLCNALVSQNFEMRVTTSPSQMFSGTVSARAKVTHVTSYLAEIIKGCAVDSSTMSMSISYSFLSCSLTGAGSGAVALFVGGSSLQFSNDAPILGPTADYSSQAFSCYFPLSYVSGTHVANLTYTATDCLRDYVVGGGETTYPLRTQLACAAKTTHVFYLGTLTGTSVKQISNVTGTTPVTIGEDDNVYEIK